MAAGGTATKRHLLVVVCVLEARNIPRKAGADLVVEARLGGESVVPTDPVPLAGGLLEISTELAWEMSRRDLQQHKLSRTPIKLQCYAVDRRSHKKQLLGYVLLDLRTVQRDPNKTQWYGLLTSTATATGVSGGGGGGGGSRPELHLSLTLEEEEEREQHTQPGQFSNAVASTDGGGAAGHKLSLVLDEVGGCYQLGDPPGPSPNQVLHTLSLTLSNPLNMDKVVTGGRQYYFYYCLLGNDITSETFDSPSAFRPERASIRVKGERALFLVFLGSQPDVKLHLCQGRASLYSGTVPIKGIAGANKTSLHSVVTLRKVSPTEPSIAATDKLPSIEALLQLDSTATTTGADKLTHPSPKPPPSPSPSSSSSSPPTPPPALPPSSLPPPSSTVSTTSTSSLPAAPSGSSPHLHPHSPRPSPRSSSASHRHPSPRSSSSSSSSRPSPHHPHHHHHPPSTTSSSTHHTLPPSQAPLPPPPSSSSSSQATARRNLVPSFEEASRHSSEGFSPLPHQPQANVPMGGGGGGGRGDTHARTPGLSTVESAPPNMDGRDQHRHTLQVSPGVHPTVGELTTTYTSSSTREGGGGSGMGPAPVPARAHVHASPPSPSLGAADAHHFRVSIDLRSLHNLSLPPSLVAFLKYKYPFFGSPYPVLIQPPTLVPRNAEQQFTHSYCSFDFASSPRQLISHFHSQPLPVEVWHGGQRGGATTAAPVMDVGTGTMGPASFSSSPDQLVGVAKVPLQEVLSVQKVMGGTGVIRQVCSLRVPVTPPTSSRTAGYVQCVLMLEDHGIVNPPIPHSHPHPLTAPPSHPQPITAPSSHPQPVTVPPSHPQPITVPPSHPQPITAPPSHPQPITAPPSHPQPIAATMHIPAPVDSSTAVVPESTEYKAALELELWKMAEEESFQQRLEAREAEHVGAISLEWQRRDEEREALMRQKLQKYSKLERQLQETLLELQRQQMELRQRESELSLERERMGKERELQRSELENRQRQARLEHEGQLERERMRVDELQAQTGRLKKQVADLERKCEMKEAEFEAFRRQVSCKPESRLQAELSILQLEKSELERKLESQLKSKQHYKEQWSKALRELASVRQREQASARERLKRQQQELELMRSHYLQHEEQQLIHKQLGEVKAEANRLREASGNNSLHQQQHPGPEAQALAQTPATVTSQVESEVARWVEERDILLQTGVYSNTDPTIQKLDRKIRDALATSKTALTRAQH